MADDKRRGVLFDVDGTLVDTTYLHTVSWWEALRQADHRVPMARIHRSIGMGSDKLLDHLLGAGGTGTPTAGCATRTTRCTRSTGSGWRRCPVPGNCCAPAPSAGCGWCWRPRPPSTR
ncbi:HAD family hydrolase [Micromonospora sp. BRA006-A]|nr:HAD family hydrolase [Micromonospora sp. BRA006-A]